MISFYSLNNEFSAFEKPKSEKETNQTTPPPHLKKLYMVLFVFLGCLLYKFAFKTFARMLIITQAKK